MSRGNGGEFEFVERKLTRRETLAARDWALKAERPKRAPADLVRWRLPVIGSKDASVTLGASHSRAGSRRLARAGGLVVKAVRGA
jgi:hypothetical protein